MGRTARQNLFGIEARSGDLAAVEIVVRTRRQTVTGQQRRTRQLPAAEQVAALHHIVKGTAKRYRGIHRQGFQHLSRSLFCPCQGTLQPGADLLQIARLVLLQRCHGRGHLRQRVAHRPALVAAQLAADQIRRLDTVGALINRGDAHIAQVLCGARLLDVAHAAVNLHPQRGQLLTHFRQPALDHRNHQVDAELLPRTVVLRPTVGQVHGDRLGVDKGAHGLDQGFHGQQHAPHIRVFDDGDAALDPVTGVGNGFLIGPLGGTQALDAHFQARFVHHREHAGEAAVLLADQVADGALAVAEGHHASGAAVDAELVLGGHRVDVVALAQAAIGVDQELGHQEQGDAAAALGRVRQLGQDQVDDIVGGVVIAPGDVDLLAVNAVVIALGNGAGFHDAEVGAGAGFGQVHGASPLARVHFRQVQLLLLFAAVCVNGQRGAAAEHRREAKGQVGAVPHFTGGSGVEFRQALTTVLRV